MTATIADKVNLRHGRLFHLNIGNSAPELADLPDLIIFCPPVLAIVEL
jgi:hypothetical protein